MAKSITTHLVQVDLTFYPVGYEMSASEWIEFDCVDGSVIEDSLTENHTSTDTDSTLGYVTYFYKAEKPITTVKFFFISDGLPMANPLLYDYVTMRMDAFGDKNLSHLKAISEQVLKEILDSEDFDPNKDVVQGTCLTIWHMIHESPPDRDDYDAKVILLGRVPLNFYIDYVDHNGSLCRTKL